MQWVRDYVSRMSFCCEITTKLNTGKVGMSVLVKGLAMDFVREGRAGMAVTGIWPASVCSSLQVISYEQELILSSQSNRLPRK